MKNKKPLIIQIAELKKELKKFKSQSIHDMLTGLYNHRKLTQDIQKYLNEQKRHKTKFLVMLIDIDDFKKINDTYGHLAGDKALKEMATILKKNVRKVDKIYRDYNGDEFVFILRKCKNVKRLIKRIRTKLSEINIKVSIGYSPLEKKVLEKIDNFMYKEKKGKK